MDLGLNVYVAALSFRFKHFFDVTEEAGDLDGRWDNLEEVGIELREDEYVVYDSGEGKRLVLIHRQCAISQILLPFLVLRAGYDGADRVNSARDQLLQLFANLGFGGGSQFIREDRHLGQSLLSCIRTVKDCSEWIPNLVRCHIDEVQRLSFGLGGFLHFHLLYHLCKFQC